MKNNTSEYIKLERSKEIRKWITYVGIPIAGAAFYVSTQHPEIIQKAKGKLLSIKEKFTKNNKPNITLIKNEESK